MLRDTEQRSGGAELKSGEAERLLRCAGEEGWPGRQLYSHSGASCCEVQAAPVTLLALEC